MHSAPEPLQHLSHLAIAVKPMGLTARLERRAGTPVLKLTAKNAGRSLYVSCVRTANSWSWLWTGNATPVNDPKAPTLLADALRA